MPQTIEIAAFVFGAVLVLLALVSGGFKFWGFEVAGTAAGKLGRLTAFVLGLIFISVGLLRGGETPRPPSPPLDTVAPPVAVPTKDKEAFPKPPAGGPTANISGSWADTNGTIFQITQTGTTFSFSSFNSRNGLQSQGTGSVMGRRLESVFHTTMPSDGTGEGTVSTDGLEMTGTFRDSTIGVYSLTLRRQ